MVTFDHNGGYLGLKKTAGAAILVVAHVDYIGTGKVYKADSKQVISSALDDRVGVYAALHLLPKWGIKADVLLTDNEESGMSSIRSIGYEMLSRYNWIVELDRNGTGAVSYGFGHDIDDYLTGYFDIHRGTYSDISELESTSPCAAFNMGVGYHREHTEHCCLVISELRKQLNRLRKFYLEYSDVPIMRDHVDGEIHDLSFADGYLDDWTDDLEADRAGRWGAVLPIDDPLPGDDLQTWDWAGTQ